MISGATSVAKLLAYAAAEERGAGILEIDQPAADIPAVGNGTGAGVNELGRVLDRETERCPGSEILDHAQLPVTREVEPDNVVMVGSERDIFLARCDPDLILGE